MFSRSVRATRAWPFFSPGLELIHRMALCDVVISR
jgi:hypothetical protein